MCSGKKKQNKEQEQEKIGVTWVHTIGDCELRILLIAGDNQSPSDGYPMD